MLTDRIGISSEMANLKIKTDPYLGYSILTFNGHRYKDEP